MTSSLGRKTKWNSRLKADSLNDFSCEPAFLLVRCEDKGTTSYSGTERSGKRESKQEAIDVKLEEQ